MEKLNDTMTICTLARPDVVTIKVSEYKHLLEAQEQSTRMIEAINSALKLDSNGEADIDYRGRNLIIFAYQILFPEAFSFRMKQLKKEAGYDSMD